MLSLDGLQSPGKGKGQSHQSSSLPSPIIMQKSMDFSTFGLVAYEAHGLSVFLKLVECEDNGQNILLTAHNKLSGPITNVQIQCAVPKSLRLALDPASASSILPNGSITQLLKVGYASEEPTVIDMPKIEPAKLKLRLKIIFTLPLSTQPITDIVDFSNF